MNALINQKAASLRNYSLSIPVGSQETFPIEGRSIRLLTANVPISFVSEDGMLGFTLAAGDEALFDEASFFRFRIFHTDAAVQAIVIAVGNGGRIGSAKLNGTVSVSGALALDAPTLAALESVSVQNTVNIVNAGQSYGASYRSTNELAANTPETIFTAAANVNGAILHSAQFMSGHGTGNNELSFLAKATAPTTANDGDAILSEDSSSMLGAFVYKSGSLKNPIKIPAGKGLFFIATLLEAASSNRSALYTFL